MNKFNFYRLCREWHGYMSAIAFVALLFFSITGIFLNHPQMFRLDIPALTDFKISLTPEQIDTLKVSENQTDVLIDYVREIADLRGKDVDAVASSDSLVLRLRGVDGLTDIQADLSTGSVEVFVESNHVIQVLNSLHRGEEAGSVWRLLIDILAVVLIIVSLLGYCLFISMRTRLKTAMILTFVGLSIPLLLFWVSVV